jgi:hypothetical protein
MPRSGAALRSSIASTLRRSVALALLTTAAPLPLLAPSLAHAQGAPPAPRDPAAQRAEARSRFERGLRAFDAGDLPGALAEFNRAQDLLPNANVLFNIAQVYAALGKPVEATKTAKKALSDRAALRGDAAAGLDKLLKDQAPKVASLEITANVAGAHVELDNVEVAQTPLAAPLEVSAGSHVLAVYATGYAPLRKEISVAGETSTKVPFELVAMDGKLAHLKVVTTLPDAQLFANGEPVGTTPFAASITLVPGKYHLELRRVGYTSTPVDLTLGDGATGEVNLAWQEDESSPAPRGLVSLHISEPGPVLYVDGVRKGTYSKPLSLPAGKHRVRVERDGFFPAEREILVEGNAEREVSLYLAPTNDTRRAYTDRVSSRRRWGWIATGAGAAITAGSTAFLIVNGGKLSDANKAYDAVVADSTAGGGGSCDPQGQRDTAVCVGRFDDASANRDTYKKRNVFGYVGVGVGVVALGTGIVLLATGDDPHRYDREPASAKRSTPQPFATSLPGGGMVGLTGAF